MDLSPTKLQFLDRIKPVASAWKPRKETKVVLVTLPSPWLISDRDMPNLGLLYVAAYLRENGVNVQVVDFCGVPTDYWFVPEADIYGVSCTTPQYPLAKMVVQKLKARQPDAYVVMGGYHPSALPEFTLEDSGCDCVVKGDGEYSMLKIVKGLRSPLVEGERVEELDSVPWPARDMISIRDYQRIGTNAIIDKDNPTPVQVKEEYVLQSRGCPFTCGYCLSGETLVNTVYGMLPIQQIAERYQEIGVYSFDRSSGKALITTAKNIRKTGTARKLMRVSFDDGTYIDCTPDHKFLRIRRKNKKKYKEVIKRAENLRQGDSVHALKIQGKGNGYRQVRWSKSSHGQSQHRMVMEWKLGRKLALGEIVHHLDHNKSNNHPDNLQLVLSQKEHFEHHPELSERMKTDNPMFDEETKTRSAETFKRRYAAGEINLTKSEETRRKMSEAAKAREARMTPEQKSARAKKGAATTTPEQKAEYTKRGWITSKKNGTTNRRINHKVVSVEELPGLHDVYCMEVPATSWFYANDVLVHNCAQMLISGRRVRYRSPDCIREEMVYLMDRYQVNRFYIFDDIFVVDKRRVEAFCDMVDDLWTQGYKFDWHCLARADVGSLELYKRMAASHCKQITYGLEHGDDRMLKHNKKECTAEQNMTAVVNAKKAGLRVRAQFIVGLPGENEESIDNLEKFVLRCPADSMAAHIFVPLPGSPIYTHPEAFAFEWNRNTDFLHYQTIGKPGAWAAHQIHKNSDDVLRWANRLKAAIAGKNVFNHDARHQAVIESNDVNVPVC